MYYSLKQEVTSFRVSIAIKVVFTIVTFIGVHPQYLTLLNNLGDNKDFMN